MNTCAICRHWSAHDRQRSIEGECVAISAGDYIRDGDGARIEVNAMSDSIAILYTRPDFGCTLYDRRADGQ